MKIPKRIKIGKKEYKVKKCIRVDWLNKNIIGQINYLEKVIKLRKITDSEQQEDYFFHEIAHGIMKELEFNFPKAHAFRNDEKFIQEMGLTLRKTFLDLLEKQKE